MTGLTSVGVLNSGSITSGFTSINVGDGAITTTGTVTAGTFTTTSDIKLKKDITSLTSGLDKILELNPVNFRWKKDDIRNNIGLIAQEVEKIIPDAVSEHNDIKHISYNMLTSTLIKGMQEMNTKVNQLENDNKILKEQLNNILLRLDKSDL